MTLVIGLDTGGTYTDAALLDTATGTVRATGKSLTTRDDLSIGVGGAIRRVLEDFDGSAADIGLVSLSTTLATNAVVEGVGGRVGLLMIGFDETSLQRADLARALGLDPVFFINGGHAADGVPRHSLTKRPSARQSTQPKAKSPPMLSPDILRPAIPPMKAAPAICFAT